MGEAKRRADALAAMNQQVTEVRSRVFENHNPARVKVGLEIVRDVPAMNVADMMVLAAQLAAWGISLLGDNKTVSLLALNNFIGGFLAEIEDGKSKAQALASAEPAGSA